MIAMKPGVRYVVTSGSSDGTFEKGDHVSINEDGSINNREAEGWINACDVPSATAGMEVELDLEWIVRRKQELRKELAHLKCLG